MFFSEHALLLFLVFFSLRVYIVLSYFYVIVLGTFDVIYNDAQPSSVCIVLIDKCVSSVRRLNEEFYPITSAGDDNRLEMM